MPVDDVAVVGGGPAGAWCACRLARLGARVAVFDPSHPREKPCGGGVTARAWALVASELAGAPLVARTVTAARFELDGRGVQVPLGSPSDGGADLIVVSRAAFDGALLAAAVAAGARHVPERVVDVDVARDGVLVRTTRRTTRARWLVGADGVTSLVRRRVWRPFTRSQLSLTGGYFVRGRTATEIVVRFSSVPAGYLWSFPRPDHLAVGMCATAGDARSPALRARVLEWLRATGLAEGAHLVPYAWPVPSLTARDWDREVSSGDRWVLVGDAAGLVDPLTREGIFFALASGDAAAEAIGGDGVPHERYAERLADTILTELRRAARLQHGFYRRGFLQLLVEGLAASPAIRRVMADLVAGRQTYASLVRRLLATCEIRLAARLLGLEVSGRWRAPGSARWPTGTARRRAEDRW